MYQLFFVHAIRRAWNVIQQLLSWYVLSNSSFCLTLGECGSTDSIGINPDQYCFKYPYNYQCREIRQPCLGHIHECKDFQKSASGCMDHFPSTRRYKWIRTDLLPAEPKCSSGDLFFADGIGTRNCFCVCTDNHPDSLSTHIFNLLPVEADIEQNKVVTGIRMRVNHRVVNLQIQQGKLVGNLQVEDPAWKEINDISEEIYAHRANKTMQDKMLDVVANGHYRIVSKGEAFDLDDLRVPHDHVLTGVKFHFGSDERSQIAIISSKFDPATGKIVSPEPNIVEARQGFRERLEYDTKYPFATTSGLLEVSKPSMNYLQFSESDWKTNSGQTTLPLFDALSVVSDPPSPLGGVGIFYKAAPGFTGLLSLKLFSLDYAAGIEESLKNFSESPPK